MSNSTDVGLQLFLHILISFLITLNNYNYYQTLRTELFKKDNEKPKQTLSSQQVQQ